MKEARQEAVPAESSLIDCVKFSVVGQKQPYTVFIGSNSLLLMDYHCHLSTEEVYGSVIYSVLAFFVLTGV